MTSPVVVALPSPDEILQLQLMEKNGNERLVRTDPYSDILFRDDPDAHTLRTSREPSIRSCGLEESDG